MRTYGRLAGTNVPGRTPENPDHCIAEVTDRDRWRQCRLPRGWGPGGLHCTRHAGGLEELQKPVEIDYKQEFDRHRARRAEKWAVKVEPVILGPYDDAVLLKVTNNGRQWTVLELLPDEVDKTIEALQAAVARRKNDPV